MKKMIISAAVFGTVLVAARRFGPRFAERGMRKCHEMLEQAAGTDRTRAPSADPEEQGSRCA